MWKETELIFHLQCFFLINKASETLIRNLIFWINNFSNALEMKCNLLQCDNANVKYDKKNLRFDFEVIYKFPNGAAMLLLRDYKRATMIETVKFLNRYLMIALYSSRCVYGCKTLFLLIDTVTLIF